MRSTAFVQPIGNRTDQRYGKYYPVDLGHEKALVKRLNKMINTTRIAITKTYH